MNEMCVHRVIVDSGNAPREEESFQFNLPLIIIPLHYKVLHNSISMSKEHRELFQFGLNMHIRTPTFWKSTS